MWLVSMAVAASTIAAPGQAAATYNVHVWSNSDAFKVACLGVNDTYPLPSLASGPRWEPWDPDSLGLPSWATL
jgi:hypothetical protein